MTTQSFDGPLLDLSGGSHPLLQKSLAYNNQQAAMKEAEIKKVVNLPKRGGSSPLVDAINLQMDVEDLLRQEGYTWVAENRYCRPGKDRADAGTCILEQDGKKVVFENNTNGPLGDGKPHDAADLLRIFRYSGNYAAMFRDYEHLVKPSRSGPATAPPIPRPPATNSTQTEPRRRRPSIDSFAINDHLEDMKKQIVAPTFVFWRIVATGQIAIIHGMSNIGKSLSGIHLLIRSIQEGHIKGEQVTWCNLDDDRNGVTQKADILKPFGVRVLVPGEPAHAPFQIEYIDDFMLDQIEDTTAKHSIFVIDTATHVLNLNDRESVRRKLTGSGTYKRFMDAGGTIILLAHVNKHLGDDGKPVYEGGGDVKANTSCQIILSELYRDKQRVYVEIENTKNRGHVDKSLYYSFRHDINDYTEVFQSFQIHDDKSEIERSKSNARRYRSAQDNSLPIEVIKGLIGSESVLKTELIKEAMTETGESRSKIMKILDAHDGPTSDRLAFWKSEKTRIKNAICYTLNQNPDRELTDD